MTKKISIKSTMLSIGMIAPSLIAFSVFIFWPLIYTLYLSFFKWNMIKPVKDFVGIDNYVQVLKDPLTYKIIGNTLFYIIILLIINFIAPYILSFILAFIIKKFQPVYRSMYFLPSVISLVVGSMIYTWILNPLTGPVAKFMQLFGMTMPVWSKTDGLVIVVISIITSWKVFGYNFIVILGGVSGVSQEVIEAARLDGIPMHKIFWDIVLPMSSATAIYIFIMTIVQGLQYVFTPLKVITQGGPDYASSNMIYNAYQEAFVLYDTGRASAFSILTLSLFVFLLWLEFRFVERGAYYEN